MIIATKAFSCNRRYFVLAGNSGYFIEKIVFFDKGSYLCSTSRGWLENAHGRDISEISLPVEKISRKRNVNFAKDEVYIISDGRDWSGELTATLYIPAAMLNIRFEEHRIMYQYQLYAVFSGDYGIVLNEYLMSLDTKLNNLISEYEEAYENAEPYKVRYHSGTTIEAIDKLMRLATEIEAEILRLNAVTVEDALAEMENATKDTP